ncbi:MAG: hypothetical protein C5B51_02300 [Terriglobia bacterium]|nr:MAG: hypothetical protein C5B51_02300 [Terriglobia bacterium]
MKPAALILIAGVAWAATTVPRVREVNVYGLRKLTAERIMRSGRLRAGETLPPSKGDLEDRLSEISGVIRARVEAVCCEGPDALLFVGIEEKDGPHVAFHSDPAGSAALPEGLAATYQQFLATVQRAAQRKNAASATGPERPLISDAEARGFEEKFGDYAAGHLPELREVLRNGSDPEERAVAAAVIGYAPSKQEVIDDLQYSMQDPDEAVRSNALRSLRAIAVFAQGEPGLQSRLTPTWPVELLNSIVLSDRLQAADLLITLTDHENRAALDQMRTQALPSLVEMARWESLGYALRPFLLVGRIAGLSDQEIHERWSKGEREAVIEKALGKR